VSARERSSRIRAWAKDQGIAVSDRGRIPAGVAEQYEAAQR
jgi:pyridoxine/pyridoxamine 5'-phosphate oxidase